MLRVTPCIPYACSRLYAQVNNTIDGAPHSHKLLQSNGVTRRSSQLKVEAVRGEENVSTFEMTVECMEDPPGFSRKMMIPQIS